MGHCPIDCLNIQDNLGNIIFLAVNVDAVRDGYDPWTLKERQREGKSNCGRQEETTVVELCGNETGCD